MDNIIPNLKIKNVVMKDCKIRPVGIEDMDVVNRKSENNENHMSITGTKQQINKYLQDKPILSERLRTLNNLPKYRIINSVKVRIY
jgi:hypothetical protein